MSIAGLSLIGVHSNVLFAKPCVRDGPQWDSKRSPDHTLEIKSFKNLFLATFYVF